MLNEHTLDQLRRLRLDGMVRAFEEQTTNTAAAALTWSIPLHSLPFDDSPLRELAQSVMCGTERYCTAFFGRPELPVQPVPIARR